MRNLAAVSGAMRSLLTRPEVEMRYEALRALEGDQDPATKAALARALSDSSRDLRALAIRTLGNSPEPWAVKALGERVLSKGFRNLQSTERRLLLVSYANVADAEALAWFEDELTRNSLFGGKKLKVWQDELRRALVEAGTSDALALVAGDVDEGDEGDEELE